ncbi:MAG: nucleoside 2-deoxyribosyltransferase [Oscillospiraceae bacterium]|nr:nucleoside 2-deoxyribosyltransferase [Oscillospiraceae bacterium]
MFIDKNGVMRMPKAYLAGTEIFYPDSEETQEKYHALCEKYGIIGFYPSDAAPDDEFREYEKKENTLHEMEVQMFTHDLNHIKRTDIIIANLNDYRGNEPDSGTAVECGIAWGMGHRCFAFIDDARPMKQRFKGVTKVNDEGVLCDKDYYTIEDFDMPLNLMFSDFTVFEGGFEDALKGIRKIFDEELVAAGYRPFAIKE